MLTSPHFPKEEPCLSETLSQRVFLYHDFIFCFDFWPSAESLFLLCQKSLLCAHKVSIPWSDSPSDVRALATYAVVSNSSKIILSSFDDKCIVNGSGRQMNSSCKSMWLHEFIVRVRLGQFQHDIYREHNFYDTNICPAYNWVAVTGIQG